MNSTVFAENMKKYRLAKKYTQEDVAEKLCNKVAIIRGGKLIAAGETSELTGGASLESVFVEVTKEC